MASGEASYTGGSDNKRGDSILTKHGRSVVERHHNPTPGDFQLSGQTIDDELSYVAGVNLQRDNADVIFAVNPSIAVRGLGGDTTRSLILLDGLRLTEGLCNASGRKLKIHRSLTHTCT